MKGLALDGGGSFGIGQARILEKVDTSKFDFFIGTSIGAANAAACAMESNANLPEFFHDSMPKIFDGHWWRKYKPVAPRYGDKELNKALMDAFGGLKLGDAKKPLFITAVGIGTKQLKVYDSQDPSDSTMQLWEVVRSATAAETYFLPWKGHADGGIMANNPSMVGVAAACHKLGCDMSDIELCSIGTGADTTNERPNRLRMHSLLSWGLWVISALLDGGASTMHEYFVRSLPLKKYTRIEFIKDSEWKMDNPKDMLSAEVAWEDDIQDAIETVSKFLGE
jgi:patatin-like phospholipase/acyl hydrolase